mmetsp:Transcript_120276/g.221221  ORF Transcript_120276/g.221221 Transcript_120276/m.221221 type:complete len:96 (+) Transcript_120276:29-316(+)
MRMLVPDFVEDVQDCPSARALGRQAAEQAAPRRSRVQAQWMYPGKSLDDAMSTVRSWSWMASCETGPLPRHCCCTTLSNFHTKAWHTSEAQLYVQ